MLLMKIPAILGGSAMTDYCAPAARELINKQLQKVAALLGRGIAPNRVILIRESDLKPVSELSTIECN